MSQNPLMDRKMSEAAYVDQAEIWSKDLTRMRCRGPGDLENAMRGIEREYGVDYWTLWSLRYRRSQVKDIGVSIYMKLRAAYEAECARQMRKMRHELEITRQIAGADCAAVVAAQAVVGEEDGGGA